jgi:ribosomal protein L37AE/L43A
MELTGELTCPACGSEEIYRGLGRRKQMAIWFLGVMGMGFMLGIPMLVPVYLVWVALPLALPFIKVWRCRNCGARLAEG